MTTTEQSAGLESANTDPVRGNSTPGRYWTTANIGEAAPAVMTPLCWSLWGPGNELAVRGTWHRFGMLGPDEVYVDSDQNNRFTGVFFGRQAMNIDPIRRYVDRFPGITADEFELGLAGALHPNAAPFVQLTDAQRALVAEVTERVRDSHSQRLTDMVRDQNEWWRREVLHREDAGDPRARLVESFNRFVWSIGIHNETRLLVVAAMSSIYRLAAITEMLDIVPALTSAFGDVAELSMGADLWALANGELEMTTFVERHGYHGENEGNPAGRSWRENPDLLSSTIAALRSRSAAEHPERRAEGAVKKQQAAVADFETKLTDEQRLELAAALDDAATAVRETELGKAAFLTAIDGFRAAARDLGDQWVAEGRLAARDDIFFLDMDEIAQDTGGSVADLVAARSERAAEYSTYRLPTTFVGMPEPLTVSSDRAQIGDVISGIGASAATHEGLVRIIRRAEDEDALELGDVLVCESTDPSWTPLFMLAAAVVIDIGSVGSHGAIIARELGLPAVINTGDGSGRLRDGDRVLVDGAKGTVTVLAISDAG
ncbi:PEP-utilizing enzyme [Rhodococcus erythropolis]|uniref:PEP-utilising enzyme mobile domain-containing protein n=1 Tax=Rhodococcus erythropolis (strain PR4 / NBRC 100887) TaxID=234621 RepID=C0ZQ35_RHOE4|nr:PEP-utilizing enzyme [Rhodococcus erythropolis]BAH31513.1 hypothetical protein RER_08050 [Rhodococcus erythropolis PR4]